MGLPACRITDQTEHGGIIILGFPQVLIGMMPASRITDMHVCPMVNVLVPHVGGPFILGSPTVLVGMMPQSRVTDTLVCVGPPDMAILGEMTVLVGMAGAGGAAGASSGAAAMGVPSAPASPAAIAASLSAAKAEAQADGTTRTFAPSGGALPPLALQQAGWPDLPPEDTANFESVQPATILPGTTLYASGDADADWANKYWSTSPPLLTKPPASVSGEEEDDGAPGAADWNSGTHILTATIPLGTGAKGWAGKGADPTAAGLQVWIQQDALEGAERNRFRSPGAFQ